MAELEYYLGKAYLPGMSLAGPDEGVAKQRSGSLAELIVMIFSYFQYTQSSLTVLDSGGGRDRISGTLKIHVKHPLNKKLWPTSISIESVAENIHKFVQTKTESVIRCGHLNGFFSRSGFCRTKSLILLGGKLIIPH